MTAEPTGDALLSAPAPSLRLLAVLVAAEGLLMLAYAASDLVLALAQGSEEWGAVWFLVVGLGAWGLGLLWVARGLRHQRRWAFTPVLFTQLIFGLVAISFFGNATTGYKVVWALVVVLAVVVLRLLFSSDVRSALITPLGSPVSLMVPRASCSSGSPDSRKTVHSSMPEPPLALSGAVH